MSRWLEGTRGSLLRKAGEVASPLRSHGSLRGLAMTAAFKGGCGLRPEPQATPWPSRRGAEPSSRRGAEGRDAQGSLAALGALDVGHTGGILATAGGADRAGLTPGTPRFAPLATLGAGSTTSSPIGKRGRHPTSPLSFRPEAAPFLLGGCHPERSEGAEAQGYSTNSWLAASTMLLRR